MATGGLGGVHRGWPTPPDVSADLQALAQTPALVVSSGVKSLLDVPATAELLETLGVPVLGYRTDTRAALLLGPRRPAGVGARRVGARGVAHCGVALGARRRRIAARAPAGREPRRRRAADRARARGGGRGGRARAGGDAVRALVLAPRERRAHAAREPRARDRERAARRRGGGGTAPLPRASFPLSSTRAPSRTRGDFWLPTQRKRRAQWRASGTPPAVPGFRRRPLGSSRKVRRFRHEEE